MVFLALKPKKLNVRKMYDKLTVEDINAMLEQMRLEIAFIDGAADIYFDEPFLYMIMDKERKIPLFVGIMENPGM